MERTNLLIVTYIKVKSEGKDKIKQKNSKNIKRKEKYNKIIYFIIFNCIFYLFILPTYEYPF